MMLHTPLTIQLVNLTHAATRDDPDNAILSLVSALAVATTSTEADPLEVIQLYIGAHQEMLKDITDLSDDEDCNCPECLTRRAEAN